MKRTTLAERLDHLFRLVHPVGAEYSWREVAEGINKRGVTITSAAYIEQVRRGEHDNPPQRLLENLADFFGVPVAYFSDDELADRVDSQLELLASIRDEGVGHITWRRDVQSLSPEQRRAAAATINEVVGETRRLGTEEMRSGAERRR